MGNILGGMKREPVLPHLFVVVRINDFYPYGTPTEQKISAVSAFSKKEHAEADAARLNSLGSNQGVRYVVLASRLESTAPV